MQRTLERELKVPEANAGAAMHRTQSCYSKRSALSAIEVLNMAQLITRPIDFGSLSSNLLS